MVISDHYAYTVLGLPIGMDRDAISERYRLLSNKLSISKSLDDKKKLEQVYAAYNQLIPENQRINMVHQNNKTNGKAKNRMGQNQHINNDINYSSSSDEEYLGRNMLNQDKNGINDKKKSKKNKKKKSKSKSKNEQIKGVLERNEESGSNMEEEIIEDEGIHHTSAFVSLVGKNFSANGTNSSGNINGIKLIDSSLADRQHYTEIKDPSLEARQNAMLGNEEANKGCYDKAVRLFTKAIILDSSDHRFFGNRSYCYDQLFQFDKALKDADKAIDLSPEWPKGHFRKGRALKGLNKLTEAEGSFENVLRYDESCQDAILEINAVRKRRIVEIGFTERQAKAAIKKYIEVQPALDALLRGDFRNALDDVLISDEDDDDNEPIRSMQIQQRDLKMNPKNPEGYTSLWVGNVVEDVTEKMLVKLFSKYGKVISVRLLKDKYCAFVNYSTKESAGIAMENLQNKTVNGSKLLIKFPNNPIANSQPNIILGKAKPTNIKPTAEENATIHFKQEAVIDNEKVRGPVNGNECYFWRTTGCIFNGSCKYLHIPEHRGVDKKTWQK